jgi:hypothetical protein
MDQALSAEIAKRIGPDKFTAKREAAYRRLSRAVRLVASQVKDNDELAKQADDFAQIISEGGYLCRPLENQGQPMIIVLRQPNDPKAEASIFVAPVLAEDDLPIWAQVIGATIGSFDPRSSSIALNFDLMNQCSSDVLIGLICQHEMVHWAGGDESDAYTYEFALLELIGGERYLKLLEKVKQEEISQKRKTGGSIRPDYDPAFDFVFGGPVKSELEGLIRMSIVWLHAVINNLLSEAQREGWPPDRMREELGKLLNNMGRP